MKLSKPFTLGFIFVLIFLLFAGSSLIAWNETCGGDETCRKVVLKGCNIVCRVYGGCTGAIWSGDCEHGICMIDATCLCEDGHSYDQTVICVTEACPM
jgi:hypothetical protein